jgi:ATP-dependent 26S proteasome regulatory subunit
LYSEFIINKAVVISISHLFDCDDVPSVISLIVMMYVGKGAVVKTSTRQTVFLPIPGLVRASELTPGELVGTNKDSYIILGKWSCEWM